MTTLETCPITTDPTARPAADAAEGTDAGARLHTIVEDVVGALRDVIVTHRVSVDEYRVATEFLMAAGEQGYEIPLLLDLFLATTVDAVQAPADGGTESNVEGPFYIPDAPLLSEPYVLPRRADEPGEILMFSGSVTATDGTPLAGALIDIWQDNGAGEYSHFHPDVPEHNLRGRLVADADGRFEFETVLPVPYEVPTTGATGRLLAALGRSAFRPAHVHFKVSHDAARPLTTQIYFAGDPWLDHDVVVGAVKPELVTTVEASADAPARCSYDFLLPPA
jgi:catechol 1,2-dioxygenase